MWNNTAFIDRMKIGNIPNRLLFCFEKAAVFETGTKRQTGPDKKSPGVLFLMCVEISAGLCWQKANCVKT